MKMFDPKNAKGWVFASVAKSAREGTAPTYGCIQAESLEDAERQLDMKALRNAYPYALGRYDEQGRYCVYKPLVEGVTPGRFVLHPLAEQEHKEQRWS